MKIIRIALDLEKHVIQVRAVDHDGEPALRRTFNCSQ